MYKQTPILQTLLQFVYLRFKFYRSLFLFVWNTLAAQKEKKSETHRKL